DEHEVIRQPEFRVVQRAVLVQAVRRVGVRPEHALALGAGKQELVLEQREVPGHALLLDALRADASERVEPVEAVVHGHVGERPRHVRRRKDAHSSPLQHGASERGAEQRPVRVLLLVPVVVKDGQALAVGGHRGRGGADRVRGRLRPHQLSLKKRSTSHVGVNCFAPNTLAPPTTAVTAIHPRRLNTPSFCSMRSTRTLRPLSCAGGTPCSVARTSPSLSRTWSIFALCAIASYPHRKKPRRARSYFWSAIN